MYYMTYCDCVFSKPDAEALFSIFMYPQLNCHRVDNGYAVGFTMKYYTPDDHSGP